MRRPWQKYISQQIAPQSTYNQQKKQPYKVFREENKFAHSIKGKISWTKKGESPINIGGKAPLMAEIKNTKKCKNQTINTDLTFEPRGAINMVIENNEYSANTDDDGETTQDEILMVRIIFPVVTRLTNLTQQRMLSNYLSVQNFDNTKLTAFWSCNLTGISQPAKINKVFHGGTKNIVDVIHELKHIY